MFVLLNTILCFVCFVNEMLLGRFLQFSNDTKKQGRRAKNSTCKMGAVKNFIIHLAMRATQSIDVFLEWHE